MKRARPLVCPLCKCSAAQGTFGKLVEPAVFLARSNKRAAILDLIKSVGTGLTTAEIGQVLRLGHATVSARVHDLQRANAIKRKEAVKRGEPARWVPFDFVAPATELRQPSSIAETEVAA